MSNAETINISIKRAVRVIISNSHRIPNTYKYACLNAEETCKQCHRIVEMPCAVVNPSAAALQSLYAKGDYGLFLEIVELQIMTSVLPSKDIWDILMELHRILMVKAVEQLELRPLFKKLNAVMDLLIIAFPSCSLAMRDFYWKLFDVDFPAECRTTNVSVFLELVERTLIDCCEEQRYSHKQVMASIAQETEPLTYVTRPLIYMSHCLHMLDLLASILEQNLGMWLAQKKVPRLGMPINTSEEVPMAIIIYYTPNEIVSKNMLLLFGVFARACAKELHSDGLIILERHIALCISIIEILEEEHTDGAAGFKQMGYGTRKIIRKFFKIFMKTNSPYEYADRYKAIIPMLSQNFVRFEFTNQLLHYLHPGKRMAFGMKKVWLEFKNHMWLKYKWSWCLTPENGGLSREDYLLILLNAARDFCQWVGLDQYVDYLKYKQPVPERTLIDVGLSYIASCNLQSKIELHRTYDAPRNHFDIDTQIYRPIISPAMAPVDTESVIIYYQREMKFIEKVQRNIGELTYFNAIFSKWKEFTNSTCTIYEPI